jgi:hypothetical protein
MPNNPHTLRLERELNYVIKQRVALRNQLKRWPHSFSGDNTDRTRAAENAARTLQFLDREHARLHHELGRPLPGPAVSLALTAADRAALARQRTAQVKAAPKSFRTGRAWLDYCAKTASARGR